MVYVPDRGDLVWIQFDDPLVGHEQDPRQSI